MKIVHCFFTMRTGGAQLLAIDMLNRLCLSHETTLIIINHQWDEALLQTLNKQVVVYCIGRKESSRNPLPIIRFNGLLYHLNPDIIHCHERRMIQLIRYKRAKTVYTIHDVGVATDTFGRYDALVAISKSVAEDVCRRTGRRAEVIHNGILMDVFTQRTVYSFRGKEPVRLVQVSRLMHEKKGQDILLRAIAKLVESKDYPPIRLDLVGTGPSLDFLTKLARTLQIETLVSFRGERDRTWIARHLADYHLLVQPSRYEGFGLTVLEGLAAGLPVVASNIDGPAEIMAGLPAGILFTSENVDECATALVCVIGAYRTAQLEAAVQETYAVVKEKFSIEGTVAGYLNLYHRLLQRPVTPAISPSLTDQLLRFLLPQQRTT